MQELLTQLNKEQFQAVITTDKPLRIIAGAGSGKTRVITTKIAYLIQELNINPKRILAVTFTNKAANEMKERVKKNINSLYNPFITTFHSFCVRVLREEYDLVGLDKEFIIIDTTDQTKIVRNLIKELNLDIYKSGIDKKILSKISNWKNSFTSWQQAYDSSYNEQEKTYAKLYREYERYKDEKGYVDFDDLILKVHNLFSEDEETRTKWQNRFDYILVDEFQDTNYTQFDLIKWLTGNRNCLTVVGDPDQTIYSWRGAKVNIILNFLQNFKGAQSIVLAQNYRSTKPILDLANHFIDNNKNREKKDIFTDKLSGQIVELKEAASRNFEAKYVAKKIKELVDEQKYQYKDFFILYRTNAWSLEFEQEFTNQKIPFQMIGGFQFRDRKVIKDVTAMLKSIAIKDDLSYERIFGFTPKVGNVTAQKLFDKAKELNLNMFEFLVNNYDQVKLISKNLDQLVNTLKTAHDMYLKNESVLDITKYLVINSGYQSRLDLKDKEDQEALQNIKAYLDQLNKFDQDYENENNSENRLLLFLQEESIGSIGSEETVANKVTLLTIHSAKGLENKVVFVVGLNKDVFPSRMSFSSIESLEEERRTFYVAITRAQELLYISYVSGEYSYISGGELGPSRFIGELNPELYNFEKNIYFHSANEMTSQFSKEHLKSKSSEPLVEIDTGNIIKHIMFGEGVVLKVVDKYISVAFSNPAFGIKSIPLNSKSWEKQ